LIAPKVEAMPLVPVIVAKGATVYVGGLPYVEGERVEVPAVEARAWIRDQFAVRP
jgi:hypothetical protein